MIYFAGKELNERELSDDVLAKLNADIDDEILRRAMEKVESVKLLKKAVVVAKKKEGAGEKAVRRVVKKVRAIKRIISKGKKR